MERTKIYRLSHGTTISTADNFHLCSGSDRTRTIFTEVFPWLISVHPNKIIDFFFFLSFALRKAHSLFQSEFSTECYLVLSLSTSSILFFPLKIIQYMLTSSSSSSHHLCPSFQISFNNVFYKIVLTEDVTNPAYSCPL